MGKSNSSWTDSQMEAAPAWIREAMEATVNTDASAVSSNQEALARSRKLAPAEHRPKLDQFKELLGGKIKERRQASAGLQEFLLEHLGGKVGEEQAVEASADDVAIKAEPASEPEDDGKVQGKGSGKKGFSRGEAHYRHQVAFINEIVPPPWVVCFGAMGSGIIGVVSKQSLVKAEVKKEVKTEPGQTLAPAQTGGEAAPEGKGEDPDHVPVIPTSAVIVLLLNSTAFTAMTRNGKMLGGYKEALDVERGTMRWSSQRRDRNNRTISTIIGHNRRGGRVIVAARGGSETLDRTNFKLLGEVGHIDDVRLSRFLVEDGDSVLLEQGTNLHHRAILPACLTPALKSGIGLTAVKRDNASKSKGRWCLSCCYEPPTALLHFKALHQEGVDAYINIPPEVKEEMVKRSQPKEEVDGEAPAAPPAKRKRMSCKGPESACFVKQEILEEDHAEASAANPDMPVMPLGASEGFAVKKEMLEALDPLPQLLGQGQGKGPTMDQHTDEAPMDTAPFFKQEPQEPAPTEPEAPQEEAVEEIVSSQN